MRKFFIAESKPPGPTTSQIYPHVTARIEIEYDEPRTDMELLATVASMISTGNMMQVTRVDVDQERQREYDESILKPIDDGASVRIDSAALAEAAREIMASNPQLYDQS